jgi:hypothetical protein
MDFFLISAISIFYATRLSGNNKCGGFCGSGFPSGAYALRAGGEAAPTSVFFSYLSLPDKRIMLYWIRSPLAICFGWVLGSKVQGFWVQRFRGSGVQRFRVLGSKVLGFRPALVRRDVAMKLLSHSMGLAINLHILICQVWARGSILVLRRHRRCVYIRVRIFDAFLVLNPER